MINRQTIFIRNIHNFIYIDDEHLICLLLVIKDIRKFCNIHTIKTYMSEG
jgi:hypothetical protein